jgi:hypothetical protein
MGYFNLMIWIDIQRMQVLQYEPKQNGGTPYMRLRAFFDNGRRIHDEILQYESFDMTPVIHYYAENGEFIATLRVLPDGSLQRGWKPVLFT